MSRARAARVARRDGAIQLELFPTVPPPRPENPAPLRALTPWAGEPATAVERWVGRLAADRAVRLVWTENRVVLASMAGGPARPTLRVHRCFRDAPDAVAEALVRLYLARPRRPFRLELQRRLRAFVAAQPGAGPRAHAPPRHGGAQGAAQDLATVLARVAARFFGDDLSVDIGWSCRPARRVLARWHAVQGAQSHIVVNRLLDDTRVPADVLDYLVYHEALHEVLRERDEGGRRVYHHAEFRRREREFPGFPAIGREAEALSERLWMAHWRARRGRS